MMTLFLNKRIVTASTEDYLPFYFLRGLLMTATRSGDNSLSHALHDRLQYIIFKVILYIIRKTII